jgi:hypothetical protein
MTTYSRYILDSSWLLPGSLSAVAEVDAAPGHGADWMVEQQYRAVL